MGNSIKHDVDAIKNFVSEVATDVEFGWEGVKYIFDNFGKLLHDLFVASQVILGVLGGYFTYLGIKYIQDI